MLKLIKKLSPYKKNNKKSWSDAMRLYNIRNGEMQLTVNYGANHSYIPSKKQTKKKRLGTWSSRFMLFTGSAITVGNIPVYSSVYQIEQPANFSSTHILQELTIPTVPLKTYSGYAKELDDTSLLIEKGTWTSYSIKKNDSFASAFNRLKLSALYKKLSANTDIKAALGKLKPNSVFLFHKSGKKITQIIYVADHRKAYIISRSGNHFTGKWSNNRVKLHNRNISFTIKTSLANDAAKVKIPPRIINRIPKVLKKDVDFRRLHRGDKIAVIYENIEFDGEIISSRNILAVSYESKDKSKHYKRIRYTLNNGTVLFLSANGNDSQIRKSTFDRKPIRGGRLSSRFNPRRKHPIFHTIRPHTGVDYAAPRGTPIHATADGIIRFRGRKGGYGKVIDIRHTGRITTRYGHMSTFKKGLRVGSRVKRGDIIGYVGSTGNSTGNHVHYEYQIAGRPVNPETVKLPTVGLLSSQEQRKFKTLARILTKELEQAKQFTSVGADFSNQVSG